jgi:hypothetical protein
VFEIPRIASRRPGQIRCRAAVRELVRSELAEEDGSRFMQFRNHGGIAFRNVVHANL